MPDCMSANEMADYVRDYIGLKKWKIVLSSGTINIFKKNKKVKHNHEEIKADVVKIEVKKKRTK